MSMVQGIRGRVVSIKERVQIVLRSLLVVGDSTLCSRRGRSHSIGRFIALRPRRRALRDREADEGRTTAFYSSSQRRHRWSAGWT